MVETFLFLYLCHTIELWRQDFCSTKWADFMAVCVRYGVINTYIFTFSVQSKPRGSTSDISPSDAKQPCLTCPWTACLLFKWYNKYFQRKICYLHTLIFYIFYRWPEMIPLHSLWRGKSADFLRFNIHSVTISSKLLKLLYTSALP